MYLNTNNLEGLKYDEMKKYIFQYKYVLKVLFRILFTKPPIAKIMANLILRYVVYQHELTMLCTKMT